jgi:beta-glucuronidase
VRHDSRGCRILAGLALAALPLARPGGLAAAEADVPAPVANAPARKHVDLDGDWRTIVDPYGNGHVDYRAQPRGDGGFFADVRPKSPSDLVEYDFDTSPVLKVPGDWNTQRTDLLYYEGPLWYRRRFETTPEPGRRYLLHFEAANYAAKVAVNGQVVGTHEGGFTPFAFDVTKHLRPGSNTVVVLVDNTRRREAVPTVMTDWWNYGGLTRPVRLLDLPETFVREYHVQLARGSSRTIAGWVRLDGARPSQQVTILIPEARIEHRVRTGPDGRAEFRFDAAVEAWSPERPRLYEVEIASETDRVTERIGFRTIEVRGTDILLNGRPVFLRGVCAHEEAPFRGGRAWSAEDARTQLGWVKELGGNFVRLAHYPHNETIVREADRLGVLVWAEIPVYWTIDWSDPRPLASARQQLAEMIGRDRNRASVVLWSVANETPISEPRNAFLRTLIDDARALDPTRLLTAALQARGEGDTHVIDDPIAEQLDVMGNNEYVGWYDGTPEKCDRVSFRSPWDKPLVMSEFGADALAGYRGPAEQRFTEDYQELLYRKQVAMLKRIPFLRGTAPWILMDFRSPRRPLPVIQEGWNRKGLVSERGLRKRAFYVLQEFYRDLAGPAKTP